MIRLYNLLKENTVKMVYLPLAVYWVILFTLTSLPTAPFIDSIRFSDKIKHFGAYLILSVLTTLAFYFQNRWAKVKEKYYLFSILIVSLYGCLDEIHQMFIPNRSAEFLDWTADTIGAVLGSTIILIFINKAVKYAQEGTNY